MNGRISRLPVAMVSVGLVGKAVTRQLEKDQDKGKLVRGRCQCVSVGMRWEGDRIRDRRRDRGHREIRARRDKRNNIEKAGMESSKQEETAERTELNLDMSACSPGRVTGDRGVMRSL